MPGAVYALARAVQSVVENAPLAFGVATVAAEAPVQARDLSSIPAQPLELAMGDLAISPAGAGSRAQIGKSAVDTVLEVVTPGTRALVEPSPTTRVMVVTGAAPAVEVAVVSLAAPVLASLSPVPASVVPGLMVSGMTVTETTVSAALVVVASPIGISAAAVAAFVKGPVVGLCDVRAGIVLRYSVRVRDRGGGQPQGGGRDQGGGVSQTMHGEFSRRSKGART